MALIDNINDGFKQLATLIKGKVNKTDVIAVAQGGTGGTSTAVARSNLGLGTAATYNVGNTAGQIPILAADGSGLFGSGLGGYSVINYSNTLSYSQIKGGFFQYDRNPVYKPSKLGIDDLYGIKFQRTNQYNGAMLWLPALNSLSKQVSLSVHGVNGTDEYYFYTDKNMPNEDVKVKSINAGVAGYKKGWRKLASTLPSAAGEVTLAHGATTVETVQAKVTNSDGVIVYNNDLDPTNQFYVRVNGANLVLGVTENSTKVFGKAVTIYVGEEL